jgi:hypothetical protein
MSTIRARNHGDEAVVCEQAPRPTPVNLTLGGCNERHAYFRYLRA